MHRTDVAVIGAGPAGMAAALAAASMGAAVTLIEQNEKLGGQLIKQTHKFFGSASQYASRRGFNIASELEKRICSCPQVEIWTEAVAVGFYEDFILTVWTGEGCRSVNPGQVVIATGARERMLPFPGNDLPGVYGAGAVQTLMHVHGVIPARSVLMVGAGNIGLILSYQLLQAGVEVKAVVEAMPEIGGYQVHAAKLRREGIPIYTGWSIKAALGEEKVAGVVIAPLESGGEFKTGEGFTLEVDTVCLAVGLSPALELAGQIGCRVKYVPQLGGDVPVHNANMETSCPNVLVAGDAAGVEEAGSALLEGELAGLRAAYNLGLAGKGFYDRWEDTIQQLEAFRRGPAAEKIRKGLVCLREG